MNSILRFCLIHQNYWFIARNTEIKQIFQGLAAFYFFQRVPTALWWWEVRNLQTTICNTQGRHGWLAPLLLYAKLSKHKVWLYPKNPLFIAYYKSIKPHFKQKLELLNFHFYGEISRDQKILHSQQTFKICFHPMIWII